MTPYTGTPGAPSGDSNEPSDLPFPLLGASNEPLDLPFSPLDASNEPLDLSFSLLEASNELLDLPFSLLEVSNELLDLSNTPLEASFSLLDASNEPPDFSNTLLDLSNATLAILLSRLDSPLHGYAIVSSSAMVESQRKNHGPARPQLPAVLSHLRMIRDLLIEDLGPSAEIYRLRLRYHLIDEAAYPGEAGDVDQPGELWRKSKPCWLKASTS